MLQCSRTQADIAAPTEDERERILEFRFTRNAPEYFRIWIVNTLLTLSTLGLSA